MRYMNDSILATNETMDGLLLIKKIESNEIMVRLSIDQYFNKECFLQYEIIDEEFYIFENKQTNYDGTFVTI